jgi:protein PhnA
MEGLYKRFESAIQTLFCAGTAWSSGSMLEPLPPCPECASEYAYESGSLLECPMCGHAWTPHEEDDGAEAEPAVKSKVGTKVRGIRLMTDGVGDHDIDANVSGFGQMQLKSSVVKKVI